MSSQTSRTDSSTSVQPTVRYHICVALNEISQSSKSPLNGLALVKSRAKPLMPFDPPVKSRNSAARKMNRRISPAAIVVMAR